jgi:4-hydroxy-tetrahydrodipicolinate synthase
MELIMFQGSIVALVTPMNFDGSIDIGKFKSLLDFHIENKTDGVVVLGTTGECPTIDFDEHTYLIKEAVLHIDGRIPVIAGTGANSTKEAVFLTQSAKKAGADACLLVTPYYNKPNQKGLFEHYKTINDAVDIPQILYNVPARTGCDLENKTVISLSKLSNIIGIKDATGELERIDFLKDKVKKSFIFISGDDLTFLDYMERGGCGVISVTANVKPDLMHNICHNFLNGNNEKSRTINNKLGSLHKALFIDSNPIPVKWLLNYLGLINQGIRLPLVDLDKKYQTKLAEAFEAIK